MGPESIHELGNILLPPTLSRFYTDFHMKPTILCVDDEIDNVDALERLFRGRYTVLKAVSGPQGLVLLDEHPETVSVIITDQRMPEMTGVEFLEKSILVSPHSVRILLTGYTDMESIIEAVNSGQIYRYLNKPWDPMDLLSTVARAVERFELNQELEKKNHELSRALQELKSLDQAKTQFMVLINHELKTPLTSILNFTELLLETRLTEEQELCSRRIQKSAHRLRSMIDDVLFVIKGEMGTLSLRSEPITCSDLRVELPIELQDLIKTKHVKVLFRWSEKIFLADRGLLHQVFIRLVHNALKFATEGSQVLVRSDVVSDAQNQKLRFAIYNQGPSLSGDVVHKIMQPFYMDENMMNHSTGTGLGLTVCQSILRAHGSRLQFQNEKEGVEVYFDLQII